MSYYAQFDLHSNAVFRFDTRIYLNGNPVSRSDGICVAAIVAKNPGSASAVTMGEWQPLNLSGDKMLSNVRNIFIKACELAGKAISKGAFVQVWNLFYLCDKNLSSALKAIEEISSPLECPSENHVSPIVWFAWGGDDKNLNRFKKRFLNRQFSHAFFFDHKIKKICANSPTAINFAEHTQGLPAQPVIKHLANIL